MFTRLPFSFQAGEYPGEGSIVLHEITPTRHKKPLTTFLTFVLFAGLDLTTPNTWVSVLSLSEQTHFLHLPESTYLKFIQIHTA